jgi:hypothetical protein
MKKLYVSFNLNIKEDGKSLFQESFKQMSAENAIDVIQNQLNAMPKEKDGTKRRRAWRFGKNEPSE